MKKTAGILCTIQHIYLWLQFTIKKAFKWQHYYLVKSNINTNETAILKNIISNQIAFEVNIFLKERQRGKSKDLSSKDLTQPKKKTQVCQIWWHLLSWHKLLPDSELVSFSTA